MISGSGSQDGGLCVYDLLTEFCMFSIQAHDRAVISVTYSASYVISLGGEGCLCVGERFPKLVITETRYNFENNEFSGGFNGWVALLCALLYISTKTINCY